MFFKREKIGNHKNLPVLLQKSLSRGLMPINEGCFKAMFLGW
jgi:hypothetical protein